MAIEALEKAVHFHPDYATGYVNLGGIYTTLGRYTEAEENLRQALALEPDNSAVHRRLGEIYLGTNRYGDAVRELEQALHIYPQDATLYFFLSQALAGDGQEEAALEALATSTQLDIGLCRSLLPGGRTGPQIGSPLPGSIRPEAFPAPAADRGRRPRMSPSR